MIKINDYFDIKGKRILEIGCGSGNFTKQLMIDNTVIPTDIKNQNLENFIKADARNLDIFADEQFDIVFGGDVLHHIDNIDIAIKEIKRVLKPNGKYIGFEVNGNWHTFYTLIFQLGKNYDNEKPLYPKEVKEMFLKNDMIPIIRYTMVRLPIIRDNLKLLNSKNSSYMVIEGIKC